MTCAAHGCPLPGTRTDSIKGAESWLCRFHFARKDNYHVWGQISAILNNHHAELSTIRRMDSKPLAMINGKLTPVVFNDRTPTEIPYPNLGPALNRKEDEDYIQWRTRVLGEISQKVKSV